MSSVMCLAVVFVSPVDVDVILFLRTVKPSLCVAHFGLLHQS